MNMSICYTRQNDGEGWVRARQHHYEAFLSFLNTPQNINPSPIEVCVRHYEDEGNFIAHFTRINDNLSYYIDGISGERVEIIMITDPHYVSFLNRIRIM